MTVQIKYKRLSLKLKIICLFASMVILLALAMIFWTKISFEDYVKNAEVCRFRSSIIPTLRTEAKNYCTSRDDAEFRAAVAEIKKINPGIISIFLTGDNGFAAGDESENAEKMLSQLGSDSQSAGSVDTHSIVSVDGKKQVVVSYKEDFDPYTLHFSFSADVIKSQTHGLAMKVSSVIGMAAMVILILGAAFLHIIISPIEKAAKDAERLSLGDFKIKLQRGSRTEAGRIYSSLSRLKESILYSMKRLDMR